MKFWTATNPKNYFLESFSLNFLGLSIGTQGSEIGFFGFYHHPLRSDNNSLVTDFIQIFIKRTNLYEKNIALLSLVL